MQVSFKQSPQAARATTKSSDVTRMMYASRAVPMAARIPVVVSIEVADGRSRSALLYGYNSGLERVVLSKIMSTASQTNKPPGTGRTSRQTEATYLRVEACAYQHTRAACSTVHAHTHSALTHRRETPRDRARAADPDRSLRRGVVHTAARHASIAEPWQAHRKDRCAAIARRDSHVPPAMQRSCARTE